MHKKFFTYLLQYLEASITLIDALGLVRKKFVRKKDLEKIDTCIYLVGEGKFVQEAMSSIVENIQGKAAVLVILKSAEKTGDYKTAFKRICEYLDMGDTVKKEFIESLTYPLLILFVSIVISYGIVSFIFPKIIPLFTSLGVELPLPTVIILFVVNWIESHVVQILLFSGIIFFSVKYVYQNYKEVRAVVQNNLLKIPGVRQFVLVHSSIHISNTVLALVTSGRSLPESFRVALEDVYFVSVKNDLESIVLLHEQGMTLFQSLGESKYFSKTIWVDFLMIGERTGNVQNSFVQISRLYMEDLISYKKILKTWSEPVLMLFIALIVLFVALSVIKPMYSIVNHVSST